MKWLLVLLLLIIPISVQEVTPEPRGIAEVEGILERIEYLPFGYRLLVRTGPLNGMEYVRVRYLGELDDVTMGDYVALLAVLRLPSPPLYPGAYDFAWAAEQLSIGAVGYVVSDITVIDRADDWLSNLKQWRFELVERFLSYEHGSIMSALLFGERKSVPKALLTDIREAGVAHLFAISGLHVVLVCGWIYAFARLMLILLPSIWVRVYAKQIAAFVSLVLSFGYVWLAGMPISAQRAYVMSSLFLLAIMLSRHIHPLRNVAIAAVLVLLWQPYSIFTPGFQMSFAAVTALIALLGPYWRSVTDVSYGWYGRSKRFVIGTFLSSLIAGLATMPFVLFHFNQIASYGLVANMVAVPLTSLWIMPWGLLALLFSFVSLEWLAVIPMQWGIEILLRLAHMVSEWPYAVRIVPSMYGWVLCVITVVGLWLCLSSYKHRFIIALPLIGLLCFSGYLKKVPAVLLHFDPIGQFAVRYDDGSMAFSRPAPSRFVRDIWLKKTGSEQIANSNRLSCDMVGCSTLLDDGRRLDFIYSPAGFSSACMVADMVINFSYVPYYCEHNQQVLSRYDIWRHKAPVIVY